VQIEADVARECGLIAREHVEVSPERVQAGIESHAVPISSSPIMTRCSALAAAGPVPPRPVAR
jgi:hypothetical protein